MTFPDSLKIPWLFPDHRNPALPYPPASDNQWQLELRGLELTPRSSNQRGTWRVKPTQPAGKLDTVTVMSSSDDQEVNISFCSTVIDGYNSKKYIENVKFVNRQLYAVDVILQSRLLRLCMSLCYYLWYQSYPESVNRVSGGSTVCDHWCSSRLCLVTTLQTTAKCICQTQ